MLPKDLFDAEEMSRVHSLLFGSSFVLEWENDDDDVTPPADKFVSQLVVLAAGG